MAKEVMETLDLIGAVDQIAKTNKIDREKLYTAIETGLITAYKKEYGREVSVRATLDRKTGAISVSLAKQIVEQVEDPNAQISLEDAQRLDSRFGLGDIIDVPVDPKNLGRVAAHSAAQVLQQQIHEAARNAVYDNYVEKENEVLTSIVQRKDGKNVIVELGQVEGILEQSQTIPDEKYEVNDHLKVYILEVSRAAKGQQVRVSRTHPGLVKRLFEMEVPEIRSGVVQIRSIAREAGFRTKMAVSSTDDSIDPIGACVGPKGLRVENVVRELRTEKIDIMRWSSDPAVYIANALNPARVLNVYVSETEKSARVVVPDNQLSLAIGREGQNARLAAKLTGWKIDIKSQSQVDEAVLDSIEQERDLPPVSEEPELPEDLNMPELEQE